jgi:uncharacterized membrane protein
MLRWGCACAYIGVSCGASGIYVYVYNQLFFVKMFVCVPVTLSVT